MAAPEAVPGEISARVDRAQSGAVAFRWVSRDWQAGRDSCALSDRNRQSEVKNAPRDGARHGTFGELHNGSTCSLRDRREIYFDRRETCHIPKNTT